MPYTEKAQKLFRAVAHGFKPSKGSAAKMTQPVGKKLMNESSRLPTRKAVGR